MAYSHWFVSRQKRQLTTILPALIAYSDVCVGKEWSGNTALQLEFEDILQERNITEHGKLRARKSNTGGGGIRTLFKQMKDLGLVFTEDENNHCQLTLIGEELVKGTITFVDAMRIQLQKYQYPSAACWAGSGSVDHSFNVHPFQFLLRLLTCPALDGYLNVDEIAYIVIHEANSDSEECLDAVKRWILLYRKNGSLPFSIADRIRIDSVIDEKEKEQAKKIRTAYYDIANTFCNYLSLTQYIDRGYKKIMIRSGKEVEIGSFIQKNPKFIPHPELAENYIRAYGRGKAAKDLRNFERQNIMSVKELKESRIRKEYVLLALKTPITDITSDVVKVITENTGIDEKEVERFLIQAYPHGNIDDFFLSYKELAHMGKTGAREFERATVEMFRKIFKMKAEHVGPIGNTPDVYVESDDERFCGIIDNKAYKNGYSISGTHRRVMEDVYIPDANKYGNTKYPLAFFTYIAGSFGSNIDEQVKKIWKDTGVCGSAMPVDIFINIAQDYAKSGYNHSFLRTLFSVNREVRLSDVELIKVVENKEAKLLRVAENKNEYGDRKG